MGARARQVQAQVHGLLSLYVDPTRYITVKDYWVCPERQRALTHTQSTVHPLYNRPADTNGSVRPRADR